MTSLAAAPSLTARIVRSRTVWICLIVVALAATLPLYVSGYILGLLTIAYYFGVFAMAWDLLFGFAGEVLRPAAAQPSREVSCRQQLGRASFETGARQPQDEIAGCGSSPCARCGFSKRGDVC